MTTYQTLRLGDILRPTRNIRAGSGEYPILSMTMRNGLVDQTSKFKKRIASIDTSDYKVVRSGQLVVGFPIDEGVLSFQQLYDEAIVSPAYGLWDVSDRQKINLDYLERYLRSPRAIAYYKSKLRGSTARRRSLPRDVFLSMPVPLPEQTEQERIAAILEKADAIRRKRQQAFQLADEFLRSVFLEMFGDPQQSNGKYPKKPIKWFGIVVTGNTPSRQDPENFGDAIEWIKSDNINTPSHFLSEAKEGLSEKGLSIGRVVPAGSILTTCIAGSKDCIGNLAIANREIAFNQQINALVPNEHADLGFLYSQLLVGKNLVQRASTNSMKGMVSKSSYEKIELLAPPLEKQHEFRVVFDKYLELGDRLTRHGQDAERLFGSLSQRAFQGGL